MMDRDEEAAELKRAIEATLHSRSSRMPVYQKVVVWVAVLAALGVVALVLISR
jgi:hypothetical protein